MRMCVCVCVCVCDELDGLDCNSGKHPVGHQHICACVCVCAHVHVCVCDELDGPDCATLLSILWAVSTCTCVCACVCDELDGLLTVQLCCASRGPSARVCVCMCVCTCDELDGLLTSTSERPANDRQAKQQACYLQFWHVCFGGCWECCNFPVQSLTLCFWVTEKTPPFISNYCFPQIHAIFIQFPLKDQNKC